MMVSASDIKVRILCGVSVAALSVAKGAAADIDTDISVSVATSTIESGAPGDINITEDGSITILSGANFTAVTLDSDNDILNEGAISVQGVDGATGVLINTGQSGSFYSNGVIEIIEDYERTDDDGDDDLDGVYAVGTNRTGILLEGAGAFTGDIQLGGGNVMSIEGNDSTAVALESALEGSLVNDGSISVVGDNARGIDIQNGLSGDFLQSGSILVRGLDANAITIHGDINGAYSNEGSVVSTGFASTAVTNYADPDTLTDDDTPIADRIDAEDLLDNASAVVIAGSIDNGVLNNGIIDGFLDDDELDDDTKDSIEDFDENRSTGSITSYGSGPALIISPEFDPSGTSDIVIGEVVETVRDTLDDDGDENIDETLATFNYNYGLINRGSITANGLNVGFEATAIRIEGTADGSRQTFIDGGIENTGTIRAIAYEANATAISLGAGAEIGLINNSGYIGGSVTSEDAHSITAILIEDGAVLSEIINTGSIAATSVGNESSAYAIRDLSGVLRSIENQGSIAATYSLGGEDDVGVATGVAIDLSDHGASESVTVIQTQIDPVDDFNGDGIIDLDDVNAPSITGNIILGAGSDLIDVQAGAVAGDLILGAGNDTVSLSDATLAGNLHFDGGDDVFSLTDNAVFVGDIYDSNETLEINVTDSAFRFTNDGSVTVRNLSIAGDSSLLIGVDATDLNVSEPRLVVSDTAIIGPNVEVFAAVESFVNADLDLTLIQAGELSIDAAALSNLSVSAPSIYQEVVSSDATSLIVSLTPRGASDFGFNINESSAFTSFLDVAAYNSTVGATLTSYFDDDELSDAYRQLLPDYSDAMTRFLSNDLSIATGSISRALDQTHKGRTGAWVQGQVSYERERQATESTGYDGQGVTLQAGWDRAIADGVVVGAAGALRLAKYSLDDDLDADIETTAMDLSTYSTLTFGGVRLDITGAIGKANFYSDRRVYFSEEIEYYAGEWGGMYYAGAVQLGYDAKLGNFYAHPTISLDYFSMAQGDYTETASSSDAVFALAVEEVDTERVSSAARLNFGRRSGQASKVREERAEIYGRPSSRTIYFQNAYVGYRTEISSTAYATNALFTEAGESFFIQDLTPYENAALFGLAVGALGDGYALSFNYDGESAGDYMAYRLGASFRLTF